MRAQTPVVRRLIQQRGHIDATIAEQRRNPGRTVRSPVERLYDGSNTQDRQQLSLLFRLGAEEQQHTRQRQLRAAARAGLTPADLTAASQAHLSPGHYRHGFAGAIDRASSGLDARLFTVAPNLRLLEAPLQTARVLIAHPRTIPRTITGLGELAIGGVAAVPQIGIDTGVGVAHGDPLRGLRNVARAAGQDFTHRYGGLLRGNTAAFQQRIERSPNGAAAELTDFATFAAPEGALLGRGLGRAARTGALGERAARFATAERPALRISGNRVIPQELSPNLIRAAGQRVEDSARARAAARRRAAAQSTGTGVRGIQPQPGEVALTTLRAQNKAQRVDVARRQGQALVGLRREQTAEVHRGAAARIASLNRHQRSALFHVLQGLVTPDHPVRAVRQLRARKAQLEAAGAGQPARVLSKTHDELAAIDYAIRHADRIFTPQLRAFQAAEAARSVRLERADPAIRNLTAEVRRLRPQAIMLGVPHPREQAAARIEPLRAALPQMHAGAQHAVAAAENRLARARRDEAVAEAQAHATASARRRAQRAARISPKLPDLTPRQGDRLIRAQAERMAAEQGLAKARSQAQDVKDMHAKADALAQAVDAHAAEFDRQFVADVRRRAAREGLPEPAYVPHTPRPFYPRSNYAPGGYKAVQGPRQSTFALFRSGRADTSPRAYVSGVAQSVKRRRNWGLVADQFDAHAVTHLTDEATGQAIPVRDATIEELRRALDRAGLGHRDWAFWNPVRFRRHGDAAPADHSEAQGLREATRDAAISPDRLDAHIRSLPAEERVAFVRSRGWSLVPREVYAELSAATRPSTTGARLIDKLQGTQSRILLANPAWLQVQIAANALLTGFGVRGNLPDIARAQLWYRRLPDDVKHAVDEQLGTGMYEGHPTHLGATADNSRLVNFWRAIRETPFAQRAGRLNPLDLVFRVDEAQNAAFKRAVLYSRVKREAYRRMGEKVSSLVALSARMAHVLSLGPRQQMEAVLRDPALFERHARATNDLLGDYLSYTARERRLLKRGVLFYGFMRYALRMLFRTMPVGHPIVTAVVAKLAQLHNSEVEDLLGGPEAPWAYSRIFLGTGKDLRSIDLARINPVSNPVLDLVQEGPNAIGALMSPIVQSAVNLAYRENLFTGLPLRIKGSPEQAQSLDPVTIARVLANDLLSTSWAYREALKTGLGVTAPQTATQGDDTLLFSPRPLHYKTAQAQTAERQRQERKATPGEQLKRDLFPLTTPRPDNTPDVVQKRRRLAGHKAKGSPGGFDFSTAQPAAEGAGFDFSTARPSP